MRVLTTSHPRNRQEFYGEAPNIEEALQYLEEDIRAGGRSYGEVYGKLHPHYLTGSSLSTSNIDYWLRRGCTFDIYGQDQVIRVILYGYAETKQPAKYRMYHISKTGRGKNIWEAFQAAFKAPEVEVETK